MNPRLKELNETLLAKLDQQQALLAKGELTDDDRAAVKALEEELVALEADITAAKEFADIERKAAERRALVTAAVTTLPHPTGNGGPPAPDAPARKAWAMPRHGRADSFKDDREFTAQEKAFRFGQWFLACRGSAKCRAWCDDNGIDYKTALVEGGHQIKLQAEAPAEVGGLAR